MLDNKLKCEKETNIGRYNFKQLIYIFKYV